jgi:hypothetical protein
MRMAIGDRKDLPRPVGGRLLILRDCEATGENETADREMVVVLWPGAVLTGSLFPYNRQP